MTKFILSQRMLLSLIMLLSFVAIDAKAQEQITVSGVVTASEDGLPMIGATVAVKENPRVGAVTDLDGNYTITAQMGNTLIFSYIGAETQEIKATGTKLNVALSNTVVMEELVVIGYGVAKKKEVTGATIQIKAEDLQNVVSSDLAQSLQGVVPGLSVTSSAGDPGSVANIQIRGVTSMSGSNTPLFVVDGVPYEDNPDISSSEIETIDILKDAASAAVYGTRGAAGVILITTKQGKQGTPKVTFSAVYGFSDINYSGLPDLLDTNTQTYVEILEGRLSGLNDMEVTSYRLQKSEDYYFNETNAYDMILRGGLSPEQTYNLNVSGGLNNLRYNVTAGYYNQEGVLRNSAFERFNIRNNLNYSDEKWTVNLGLSFMRSLKEAANSSSLTYAISYMPYSPYIDEDAVSFTVPGEGYSNEVSVVEPFLRALNSKTETLNNNFNGNINIARNITKDLVVSTRIGYGITSSYGYYFVPDISIYDSIGDEVSSGSTYSTVKNTAYRNESLNWEGALNYVKQLDKHKITGTLVSTYEQYDYKGFYAQMWGIENDGADDAVLNMGTWGDTASSLDYYTDRLFGTLGRLMYSYDERYLFSASLRADASSKFSDENRWGYFPSVSAGWNISDEKFWEPISRTFNSLKFRVSYGQTGNQSFTSYSYQNTLVQNYDYVYGSSTSYGQTLVNYSNSDVKWETTIQTNIGFDAGFMNNKFTLTADLYNTDKRDMLSDVKLPASTGAGTSTDVVVVQNIGNMTNKGYEISFSYKDTFSNGLGINTSINFSTNENVVTKLSDTNSIIYTTAILIPGDSSSTITAFAEGYEAGSFFVYETAGVANTEEKLAAFQEIKADAQMGDMIFVDQNGDGQLTDDDRIYCGSGLADYEIGFNLGLTWKGFDFSTNWYASVGAEIMNGVEALSYDKGRNANLVYQWSEHNTTSEVPTYRGSGKEHMNYIGYSDLWVEDGSYLRMKTITLGYTLPKSVTNSININSIRVYVTGQNLLTFTGYTGMDPEIGGNGLSTRGLDKGGYPVSEKYMAGFNIVF
ncbi:MAG: TonB-dependent receptor [Rikenellaceae bacterium]